MQAGTEAQPKLYTIIGTNGTGKSTFCNSLVQRTIDNGGRALIITPHDVEWLDVEWLNLQDRKAVHTFTGIRKAVFNKENTLKSILENYNNGLLVFDDCRVYFRKMTSDLLEALFISRRQKRLSQIVVGHGFTAVPPVFFTYTSYFVLFRTTDNIKKRADCINDLEILQQHQTEINAIAKTKNPHYHRIISNS